MQYAQDGSVVFHPGPILPGGLLTHSALIWQKEASDKSDISRKRAKCVCHLH